MQLQPNILLREWKNERRKKVFPNKNDNVQGRSTTTLNFRSEFRDHFLTPVSNLCDAFSLLVCHKKKV